jgi:hypothetical protein
MAFIQVKMNKLSTRDLSNSSLDLYADIELSSGIPTSHFIQASSTNECQKIWQDNSCNNDSKDSNKNLNRPFLNIQEPDTKLCGNKYSILENACFVPSSVSGIDKVKLKLLSIEESKASKTLSLKKSVRNLPNTRGTHLKKSTPGNDNDSLSRFIHSKSSPQYLERDSELQVIVRGSISQPKSRMKEERKGQEASRRVRKSLPIMSKAESEGHAREFESILMRDQDNSLFLQGWDNKLKISLKPSKSTTQCRKLSSQSAPDLRASNRKPNERRKKGTIPSSVRLEKPALTTRNWRIQISERFGRQSRKFRNNGIPDVIFCYSNFDNNVSDDLTATL